MSDLLDIYPVEVNAKYCFFGWSQTVGYDINLVFKNTKDPLVIHTSDCQSINQCIDEIDDFCLNGLAQRLGEDQEYERDCCFGYKNEVRCRLCKIFNGKFGSLCFYTFVMSIIVVILTFMIIFIRNDSN